MRVGRVELLDKYDNVIRHNSYNCKTQRQKIIKMWEREYANKLNGCTIQISPDDKFIEQTVNEKNGLNKRKDYKKRRKK